MTQQVRKVLSRRDLALRGLVAVVGVALVLAGVWMRMSGTFGGNPHVSAEMADAGGSLVSGADVKIRGVIVGRVTSIGRGSGGGVRVNIDIPSDDLRMVPNNVVARILPATVFGTSYVDLVTPGRPATTSLRAGAVIPADKTQGTLELQQALDDIDSLVKAVGPAELASAIGSAAQALDGRGLKLGDTIDVANAYLAKLNPRMPAVREDLSKLADNLELARGVLPDFLAATDDLLVTARTLVEKKASLATLISGGTTLTARANGLLSANQAALVRFIDNSAVLLDVVYQNRHAGITGAIATNRALAAKLATVVKHGYINSTTSFELDVPPYYTAADCPRFGAARATNCAGSSRVGMSATFGGGGR
ncbi:MAG: MCE family protein [Nocardioidaceae bacterium]|nr:MCE family protein [Nocardioidaceae bacterium]